MVHIDTALMRPSERIAYWHEEVRRHVIELDCKAAQPEALLCSMQGFSAHHGAATRIRVAQPLRVDRTSSAVGRDDSDAVIVNIVLDGAMHVEQGGTSALLQAGDFALCMADRPYVLNIPSQMEVGCFRIPVGRLGSSVSLMRRLVARRLNCGTGMARLLRAYAVALLDEENAQAGATEPAFHHLALLVGAAAEEAAAAAPARGTEHRERLMLQARAIIARHIDDSELSVASVASAMRISTRYLQQLWCEEEESLAGYIAEARLARVAASLASKSRSHESLTQIAFSHGFNNPSHFSRAFRRKFGTTPGDFRRAHP